MKSRKNLFIRTKESIVKLFNRRNPMELFVFFVAVSLGIYVISSLISYLIGGNVWSSIFFDDTHDAFMDLFNSMRDVHQGEGVYTERHVIYPPLANVLFLLFSYIMPDRYLDTPFKRRLTWDRYDESIIVAVLFSALIILILFLVVKSEIKIKGKVSVLFILFLIVNAPVAYSIERGNILLICVACITYYLFNFKSESKFKREMALICLAVAINIKVYPVVFGLFLLQNKQWKEILRCILYTAILLIAPSFLFGGPECLIQVVKNVMNFSSFGELPLFLTILNYLKYPLYLFLCVFFIIILWKKKMPVWKVSLIAVCILLCNTSTHSIYMWPFTIGSFIMFAKEEKLEGINCWYFAFMILPFLILPTIYEPSFYTTNSPFVLNGTLLISQVGILLLGLIETFPIRKGKKNKAEKIEKTNSSIEENEKKAVDLGFDLKEETDPAKRPTTRIKLK